MKLSEEKCTEPPALLSQSEAKVLASEVSKWALSEKAVSREFIFKDFRQAMDFVNRVARVAEEQGHHPDILISYKKVKLTLSTHKAGGLSRNDFIMAAKIDLLV